MDRENIVVQEAAPERLPRGFVAASPEAAVAAQICVELGCRAEAVVRAFAAPSGAGAAPRGGGFLGLVKRYIRG